MIENIRPLPSVSGGGVYIWCYMESNEENTRYKAR